MEWLKYYSPFKNIHKRIDFWMALLLFGIFVDEIIKEGYFLISDIFKPFTHENLMTILIIAWIIYKLKVVGYGRSKKSS